jgi:hypothetical protein
MEVLLDPGAMSVKRVVARGHLKVTLPTREIVGEEADYLLAEGKTVITGNPLEVDDRELGKSRARRLTYFAADGRIVLENR